MYAALNYVTADWLTDQSQVILRGLYGGFERAHRPQHVRGRQGRTRHNVHRHEPPDKASVVNVHQHHSQRQPVPATVARVVVLLTFFPGRAPNTWPLAVLIGSMTPKYMLMTFH